MAVLSGNDALVSHTLDPYAVFSTRSHTENRSPVSDYRRAVQMVLENPEDRENLTKALQEFQMSMVVEELIDKLKQILDAPNKRILYKYISPLIPTRLRGEYKSLVPHIPGFEKKIVRLEQKGNHAFGFAVRGGKEFDCGIYVVKVSPSSNAALNGLKPGDQIMRVNGLTLTESTNREFVELLKLRKSLSLAVKSVGLIPEIIFGKEQVTWKAVGETRSWISRTRIGIHGPIRNTRRIQATLRNGESLGANVKINSAIDAGVQIVNITPNSPAFAAGLKAGDEILEVNGRSLIGKSHDQAIAALKSSDTLMMTIRADKVMSRESTALSEFEFTSQDHDTDALMLSGVADSRNISNETFVLRERQDQLKEKKAAKKRTKKLSVESGNRISVFDTEVEQSHFAPVIASPAAFGHGPTLAMPTLMGMGQQTGTESVDYSDAEFPLSMSGGLNGNNPRPTSDRQSRPLSDRLSTILPPTIGQATVDGAKSKERKASSQSQQQDLSSFQFPVDDEDNNQKNISRQKSGSAMKRSTSATKDKKPKFSENVEIIPERQDKHSNATGITTVIHQNNYTFSDEIVKGRKVVYHSVPKDGPLRLAIRGGKDTPLGPQIIISRIIEDGAASRYGKLYVGDQVLVIEGISLIDVTHDEAGQAFKRAMEIDSQSIELVVAVNPEKQA